MDNTTYVSLLNNKEKELIKICNYHNIYNYDCDDIIQDLYVVLLDFKDINRYVKNNEPNMFIIFAIIKNLIYHFRKKESIYSYVELFEFDVEDELPEEDKFDFVNKEISKIEYWFDRNIVDLYVNEIHTIQGIEKKTKISYGFIQPIIRKFKKQCRENYENKKD